jgi:hypothetical protein
VGSKNIEQNLRFVRVRVSVSVGIRVRVRVRIHRG